MRRVAELLARAAWALRRVLGAPDYAAYVEHVRRAHPGAVPLPREEFVRDALTRRFEKPGAKCC